MRSRAARRRAPFEYLLQAIAKSLQVGLFGSMRCALISHTDEGGDKLEVTVGHPRGFSDGITSHNKHISTSNQLTVIPSMFCCQHIEHTHEAIWDGQGWRPRGAKWISSATHWVDRSVAILEDFLGYYEVWAPWHLPKLFTPQVITFSGGRASSIGDIIISNLTHRNGNGVPNDFDYDTDPHARIFDRDNPTPFLALEFLYRDGMFKSSNNIDTTWIFFFWVFSGYPPATTTIRKQHQLPRTTSTGLSIISWNVVPSKRTYWQCDSFP